jgi:hypothetical protein
MRPTGLFCLPALLAAIACGSSSPRPAEPAPAPARTAPAEGDDAQSATPAELAECPTRAGLCFQVTPADAQLEVDGDVLGLIQDLGRGLVFVEIEPGIHMITLKRDGFVTWRAEVSVAEAAETINVTMEEKQE